MPLASAPLVIGYCRVSTAEQASSGAGLDAQTAVIASEAARRGWTVTQVIDGAVSGSVAPASRPALGPALSRLDKEGGVLVVARLDRLGRSLADVASLLDRAQKKGWSVVTADTSGLDMSTPTGRLVAGVLASAAAFERDLIRQRTREALAARKAAGITLGRPRLVDPALADRIRADRTQGATLQAIADELNATGMLTPTGRQWTPGTIRKITQQTP